MAGEAIEISTTPPALKPPFSPDIIPIPSSEPPSNTTSPTSPSSPHGGLSNSQPTQPTASQTPLTALASLPTIAGSGTETFLVADDIPKFLEQDLDLSRLNRIHTHLWMAGRPMRARPLHRYKMMGHEVLHTQQMDLHLLKFNSKLLVKPLPEYFLSYTFWQEYLCAKGKSPTQKEVDQHKSATGFLLSYTWLIVSPLDLIQAQTAYLLPPHISYPQWKAFVSSFCAHVNIYTLEAVHPRYHFGDLRLGRINSIYRIFHPFTHFIRGYLYNYNRYVVFFERNFSWLLIVFVFFSVVLSAMQVGVAVKPLDDSDAFRRATVGFVVFSVMTVAVVLGIVGLVFSMIFLYNMGAAVGHVGRERRARKRAARGEGGKEA